MQSFIPVSSESHFSLENLPFGVFRPRGEGEARVGVAIGEFVLDLSALEEVNASAYGGPIFRNESLNPFMALGGAAWQDARRQIQNLLRADNPTLRDHLQLRERVLIPRGGVEMLLPVSIGDYTDFYSSREHATNVGALFRGRENALLPNWLHLPVAYHGRASSVVVSGTDLHRPCGQTLPDGAERPVFGPSRAVDFELEVGFLIGPGNSLGQPISVQDTLDHVFGMVLVNDWSARDIQKWEYVPLGPFLSKNFGTSISPWVVTLEALAPFQTEGPRQSPAPLPYLQTDGNPTWDIALEVWLQSRSMREPQRLCASNLRHLYWNIRQQIAHHTCGGCNLGTGDLLATGTVSGPTSDSLGCLLELTAGGQQSLSLPGGEVRRFLEDGDRVTLTAWCQADNHRIGFGDVTGRLLPAMDE
jgi:fumarylacetoacetase